MAFKKLTLLNQTYQFMFNERNHDVSHTGFKLSCMPLSICKQGFGLSFRTILLHYLRKLPDVYEC